MALIDVSELMSDPDFASGFALERRIQYVNDHGRNETTVELTEGLSGSIQPASGKTLDLFPDLVRASDQLEIWTTTRLQIPSPRAAGDIIVWQSRRYTVVAARDYSDWGSGFVVGVINLREFDQADA